MRLLMIVWNCITHNIYLRLSWQRSKILHDRISCSWKVSNYTMYDHAPLIKAKTFWTTHFNRKWGFFPFNMPSLPWRYTTCIAYYLYTWRGDLIENFGKTTAQECPLPVLPVKLACAEEKVPLVTPHEPLIRPWRPETQPIRKGWLIGAVYFVHWTWGWVGVSVVQKSLEKLVF